MLPLVDVGQHIAALRREGELLASAAAEVDPGAPVPTCPEWRVRDLLRHMGSVHRWAAAHVAERRAEPIDDAELEGMVGEWPPDAELAGWLREGHARLVGTLEAADPDVSCWTFLPAPTPLAFWARRQAHETGIHRVDAEVAAGRLTVFDPGVAADGIDELLCRFAVRPRVRLRADPPRTLHVHAIDAPGEWLVAIGPQGVEVRREHLRGDCAVRAPASDLFVLLWNRRTAEGLEVIGDAGVLDLWRSSMQVRWS